MKALIQTLLDTQFYIELYSFLGPFSFVAGIVLTMIEAFIPPFPLALLVTVNVIAFGFIGGYVLSYIGSVIGSFLVFLLLRKYGLRYIEGYVKRHPKGKSLLAWMRRKGVFPLFILLTFPFTPSILVSGLAAISDLEPKQYLMALLFGKLLMIFSLSFIGYNIQSFLGNPMRSTLFIGLTLLVSLIARIIIDWSVKSI